MVCLCDMLLLRLVLAEPVEFGVVHIHRTYIGHALGLGKFLLNIHLLDEPQIEHQLLHLLRSYALYILRIPILDGRLIWLELVRVLLQQLYALEAELLVDVPPERIGERLEGPINLKEVCFCNVVVGVGLLVGMEGLAEHEVSLSDLLVGGGLLQLQHMIRVDVVRLA